jgi:hypothetical protein
MMLVAGGCRALMLVRASMPITGMLIPTLMLPVRAFDADAITDA